MPRSAEPEAAPIFPDSPEAAALTTLTGWVSRVGSFHGDDEYVARYAGATHARCKVCNGPSRKSSTVCDECSRLGQPARYAALPTEPWDGYVMLYSWAVERYFDSPGAAEEYLEDDSDDGSRATPAEGETPTLKTLADLLLVLTEPEYPQEIDEDRWLEMLPEGDDQLPSELQDAVDRFNASLDTMDALSFQPRRVAVDLDAPITPSPASERRAAYLKRKQDQANWAPLIEDYTGGS